MIRRGLKFLLERWVQLPVHGAPHDYRRWTPIGIKHELSSAGFEVVEVAACGGVFSSICINLHLAIRYRFCSSSRSALVTITAALPLLLLYQAITNLLALVLDKMDRSDAFPLTVAVLARKVVKM